MAKSARAGGASEEQDNRDLCYVSSRDGRTLGS